jgi:hypothetical protein
VSIFALSETGDNSGSATHSRHPISGRCCDLFRVIGLTPVLRSARPYRSTLARAAREAESDRYDDVQFTEVRRLAYDTRLPGILDIDSDFVTDDRI